MKVCIVGGGLVGALDAIFFAKRGEQVELFELREDIRTTVEVRGRSINLALSARGLAALHAVGLEADVAKMIIPMHGRMLHAHDGRLTMSPYGVFGEAINSIDRRKLNELLLNKAQKAGVKLHFKHDLQETDLDKGQLTFLERETGKVVNAQADLIIGADGAYAVDVDGVIILEHVTLTHYSISYSTMRKNMMRRARVDFAQEYIEHGYMELSIPASAANTYAMDGGSLHIWPRRSFMMIALPNMDKSFTLTLFMPFSKFEAIKTERELLAFFEAEFPDSIPLIGRKNLVDMFFANPVGSLVSVKMSPYHYKDKMVLVGDASHAMGMNCGFEDCLVLDRYLYQSGYGSVGEALEAYSRERHEDLIAIVELAKRNYEEMRSNVLDVSYRVRKSVEGYLHYLFPKHIIPLYTMVSFSTIPYATVVRRWQRQTLFLYGLTGFASGAVASAALWLGGAWSSTKRISGAGAVSGHPNTIPVDEFVDTVKTSVAGKLRSWAGWSVNKAGDAVSYTANKAGDAVSYTANKAGDAASYTVGKAGDALTYTANKTSDSATALKRRIFG